MTTLFTAVSLTGLLLVSGTLAGQPPHAGPVGPPNPPVSVETFVGDRYLNFQLIVAKPFEPGSRVSFFNVTNFNGSYQNEPRKNEFLTQALLNYRLVGGLSVAGGATLNYVTGFRPTAGLQYTLANRQWLLVLLPRMDLRDDNNLEGFALLEYKPRLTKTLGLYSRLQGLYNYNTRQEYHDRSYLYARLGLTYQHYAFGFGANFDQYGPFRAAASTYGAFIRAELFN
jgi:hypothetical protein